MKLISILVREFKLEVVKQALNQVDVVALTVVEARDYAPQFHGMAAWRGYLQVRNSSPKLEVQVVVHDDDVDEVVDSVMWAARTGAPGDGHVCVIRVDHRYSISSGRREA
jgi:nitrogen regulatory protein PII